MPTRDVVVQVKTAVRGPGGVTDNAPFGPGFAGKINLSPSQDAMWSAFSNVQNTADAAKVVLSAAKLTTPRNINGVAFDGQDDIVINAVDVTPRIAVAEKGAANGVPPLDAGAKIAVGFLPDAVVGAMKYQGTWNANTNTPAIPAAAPANQGHYRVVSVAGNTIINGTGDWVVGDWIVSDGAVWAKIDNSDKVSSVAGKTGVVALAKADVGLDLADNTSDEAKPVSAAVRKITPKGFTSSWAGTESALLAQIDANPAVLTDDSAALQAAIEDALATGRPLLLNEPIYVNTPMFIQCGALSSGKRLKLVVEGNGIIVGGPDIDGPVLKIQNSGTIGAVAAGSVDLFVSGLRVTTEKVSYGGLSGHNCMDVTGFRRKHFDNLDFRAGSTYLSPAGDSGLFATGPIMVTNSRFTGFPDLGVYISGSAGGATFNAHATLANNTYINCNQAWSAKRNYSNVISIGERFIGCYGGPSVLPVTAEATGNSVTVIGPIFENMVRRCIDARGSQAWNVKGMVVRGTFGIDSAAGVVAGASVVSFEGCSNCDVEGVVHVTGSDPGNTLIRFQDDDVNQSTHNRVRLTATGSTIGNGVIEGDTSDYNDVELKVSSGVTTLFTLTGANSTVRWVKNGVRGFQVGAFDRLENRRPVSGTLNVASATLTLNAIGQTIRFEPAAAAINAVLPAGATNGDIINLIKTAAAGVGIVSIRDPTNSTTITRILNANDLVTMIYNGVLGEWVPLMRSTTDYSLTLRLVAAANVPTPPAGCKTLFIDSTSLVLRTKDSAGALANV